MRLRLFGWEITIGRARKRRPRPPRARPVPRLRIAGLMAKTETTFGVDPIVAPTVDLTADRPMSRIRAEAPALGIAALTSPDGVVTAAGPPDIIRSLAELEERGARDAAGAVDCKARGFHRVFVPKGTTPEPGSMLACEDCHAPVPVQR